MTSFSAKERTQILALKIREGTHRIRIKCSAAQLRHGWLARYIRLHSSPRNKRETIMSTLIKAIQSFHLGVPSHMWALP